MRNSVLIALGLFFAAAPASAEPFAFSSLTNACKCEVLREMLTAGDVAEIERIPSQVRATIAANTTNDAPGDTTADAIASQLADGTVDGRFDRVRTGKRACTVYWFGFLDNRSQRVGRHQCEVSRKGDRLSVRKITGDRLVAEFFPFAAGVEVFYGRTYLAGHSERAYDPANPENADNENYGNKVGFALADKRRLYLVNIDERGFTEPDATFFEVIVVE